MSHNMFKSKLFWSIVIFLPVMTGCTVGPNYQKPVITSPVQFKEAKGWKVATPKDAQAKGEWWEIYNDSILNQLEAQVVISNQNVAQYVAKYQQAAALVNQSQSSLLPNVTLGPSATRSGKTSVSNSYTASLSASWELDLWGRLKRQVQENTASTQASFADLANATLSAQTTLAQNYFALRVLDQRIHLYDQTIQVYRKYATVLNAKYTEGIIAKSDLTQAEQSLHSSIASREDLIWQRAQYEHAIAVLVGKMPADFNLETRNQTLYIPNIPIELPSELLERRADIAAAERRVAAANEAVGIAIAGYFPSLSLSGSAGYSSNHLSELFSAATSIWSLGASATQSILDFGANKAKVASARATYDETVASYRQTVLDAMQNVEDYLVKTTSLEKEFSAQQKALVAATESARIIRNQYEEGVIDYTSVATTEATRLSSEQSLLQLQSTQLQNSVALISALGGGWSNTK